MAVYYIDYASGNDTTGNGSSATPYKTLAKALTVAGNNDTVLARGSVGDKATWFREYNHTISEAGLTLAADTGHTPVFAASHEYTSWSATAGTTNVYEAAYASANCWGVWNGTQLLASVASTAACDSTPNSRFFDNAGDKLYVNIGGGAPTSIEAYDVANAFAATISGAGVIVREIIYYYQMQALRLTGGADKVQQSTFRYNTGFSTGASFGFISSHSAGNTIENCIFSHGISAKTFHVGTEADSSGLTVRGCNFNTGHTGVYLDYGTGNLIEDCVASGMSQDGYNAIGATTGTIRHCTAINSVHGGIRAGATGGTSDWVAHHNIVYKTSGEMAFGLITDGGNTDFHHNVVCWVANGIIVQTNGEVNAYNNIFANCTGRGVWVATAYAPTGVRDYNCVYSNVTDYCENWALGAHDIMLAPQFAHPGAHDFRLLFTSPCIDAGVLVTGINEGFRGAAPDMGAFEYVKPLKHGRRRFAFFDVSFLAAWARGRNVLLGGK